MQDRDAIEALFACQLDVGLAVLDRDLRYCRINAALAAFNGLPVEEHLGRSVREVLPQAYPHVAPLLQRVLQGESLTDMRVAVEVPSLPGRLSEWDVSYLPIRGGGEMVDGVLVKAVNITLGQAALRALQESEDRVRRVLDSLFAFVGVMTPEGILLEANRAPLEAAGIRIEDVKGRHFWDTFWWSHDPALQDWLRGAASRVAQGEVVRRDVEVRMARDTRMTIDFMLAPMYNDQGTVTHLIPSAIDVSGRVATEARFRSLFDQAPEGMMLVNASGHMLLVNRSMGQIFACVPDQLLGQHVNMLLPLDRREVHGHEMERYLAAPAERIMAQRRSLMARRLDGSEFPVEVALNPIPGREPPEILVTVVDITERLAAQATMEASLQEKTMLLNEVHHRVKNNLQIVASLLDIQSRSAGEVAREVLRDSRSRVGVIAMTHQMLYEGSNFTGLELGPYLSKLVQLLKQSYQGDSSRIDLQVTVPVHGMRLETQKAIPCGLIANELVVNAFKHAYPSPSQGSVRVTARRDGQRVVLEVRDDGQGFPADFKPQAAKSMGYQLVCMLAQQLDAELEVLPGPGAGLRVTFLIED
ncbi:MAG: PAS domain S-box protein [Hylemonella sp.]|uniref:PAS domain S-box protein n=1 Tax=Hylemonella sp. TaxID=2066020 RepID=UPI0022C3CB64|nr:PAS domain S-box protein [Hylemonella sp.]MCZ8250884.1 PAS domain S-box protein [Hylemonella sp.]